MRRTTTPTHVFDLSIDPTTITALTITYAQRFEICGCTDEEEETRIILVKRLSDVTLGDSFISVKLTQAETNLFDITTPVLIQLHILVGDNAYQSDIFSVPCREALNDEVLT